MNDQQPPLPTAPLPAADAPIVRPNGGPPVGAPPPAAPQVVVEKALSQGFVRRDTGKLVWSPRLCHQRGERLRGHVISKELLGFQGGMPFTAYLLKLTQPTPAEDRLGRAMIAPPGLEIFVLREPEFDEWDGFATNKDYCYEVEVLPEALRKFDNGLEAWTFFWGVNAQPAPRAQIHPKSAALLTRLAMVSGG